MDVTDEIKIFTLLYTAVVPLVVVGVTGALLLGGRDAERQSRPVTTGLSVALAFALAHQLITHFPKFPPIDSGHWLPFIVVGGAGLMAVLDARRITALPIIATVAAGVTGVELWLLSRPLIESWSGTEAAAWMGGTAGVGLATWLIVDRTARRVPAPAVLGAVLVAALGGSGISVLSGSALFAQLYGALAAAAGGAAVVALWRPGFAAGGAVVAVAITVLLGLSTYAHHFFEVPLAAVTLVVVTPMTALAGLKVRSPFKAAVVCTALALVPAGIGSYLAHSAADAAAADSAYPSYY